MFCNRLRTLTTAILFTLAFVRVSIAVESGNDQHKYPFSLSPEAIVSSLAESKLTSDDMLFVAERQLLADACDGKLDEFTIDEALLIASGVTNREALKQYVAQLDRLEAEAAKALAGAESKLEQGDRLLKFLHSQPMASGYSLEQTDPLTVLETGKFNCVSSAALFNILATRLGYEVRAVEIPEHVFSIFHDGTQWVDVETTNALGFNPSRDPAEREKIKKPNGVVYMPERHAHLRREVDVIGLTAIIYYNHGVALAKEKRFGEAMIASFISVALDPANASARKNALAHMNNWVIALGDKNEFEKALGVVAVGLRTVPNDSTLLNNRLVIWQDFANWTMEAGREDEAIAVLRRASDAVPSGDFVVRQAYLFEKQADALIGESRLEDALSVIARGLSKVDEPARKRLQDWRTYQVHNHVRQALQVELAADRYDAALAAIAARAKSLNDENIVQNFEREVYDTWAKKLAAQRKWQEAVDVYTMALRLRPADQHLSQNAVVNFDVWARSKMQAKDWKGAIQIYEQGLQQFPNHSLLTNNLNYCKQQS